MQHAYNWRILCQFARILRLLVATYIVFDETKIFIPLNWLTFYEIVYSFPLEEFLEGRGISIAPFDAKMAVPILLEVNAVVETMTDVIWANSGDRFYNADVESLMSVALARKW